MLYNVHWQCGLDVDEAIVLDTDGAQTQQECEAEEESVVLEAIY